MGYNFICIQKCANQFWIRNYHGLTIIGLPGFSDEALFQQCASILVEGAKLIISSPFTLMTKKCGTKNIGISHGIYWDQERLSDTATLIASKANDFDRIVSVDTATVNFIRGHQPSYACNIDYIPNYVDHSLFSSQKNNNDRAEINILYPRRLYGPRGFWVVCKILPGILSEFKHVNFIFCGKGDESEIKKVRKLEEKYFHRVKHVVCDPYEMNKIYKEADIVLIPTIHSEGTSLSLIEAMASKKAIIATCVGGITDLVTDEFTGMLIKPDNATELSEAVKKLIIDNELRDKIAENAYKKSFSFSIDVWKRKWQKTITSLVSSSPKNAPNCFYNFSLLHLKAGGIVFDKMKQRPQHLFQAISKHAKCFFIEDKKGSSQKLINENMVLSEKDVLIDTGGMILYTYMASNLAFIKNKRYQALIYDVLDNPAIHNNQEYLDQHKEMLSLAPIIITSSKILFEEYKSSYKEKIVRYIPNAVSVKDFEKNNTKKPHDDFPAHRGNKVIGYYGAIAEWFDYELIKKTASIFNDAAIILLGPCREGFPEREKLNSLLQSHRNLYYLGEKKYNDLPAYASLFDVSIIPFVINDITQTCSPVKLFEYMALGKPIITTDMPECRQYQSAMVAKDHDEFISLIDKAFVIPKDDEYFQIMKKEAEENTWGARAEVIIEAINENINAGR